MTDLNEFVELKGTVTADDEFLVALQYVHGEHD